MRYSILFLLFLHLSFASRAQSKMPASLVSPLAVSRADFSHPWFLYGIKPMPGVKDSKQDVVYRPFQMVYEIGYVKKPTVITEPSLFIGFYGFTYPVISRLDTLWSRPADTTTQPCVHNLLADVFMNSYESFETSDPKPCKLLVFDLSKNQGLSTQIGKVTAVPASAKGIFYLFWDTRLQPKLPEGFSGEGMIEMDVAKPARTPKNKAAMADSKSAPPPVAGKPEAVAAIAVAGETVKSKTSASTQKGKQEASGKKQTQDNGNKPEPKTQGPVKTDPVKPATPVVALIHAPEISKSLYPDLWGYATKQTPSLDQADITLKLSKRNDSLIAYSKKQQTAVSGYPLALKSYPVALRPIDNAFPVEITSAKVKAGLSANLRSVNFGYKGQRLLFSEDKTNTILQIPECFSNRQEITGNWDKPAILTWPGASGSSGDTLFVTLEKIPLRITVVDEKTSIPVNGCIATVRVQGKIVSSMNINSTGEIQGLYRLESIYQLSIQHDDYYSKSSFLLRKDFDAGKTVTLINQPVYDVFYISTATKLKNEMLASVEQKFESVIQLNLPFILFVSNTDKPLVTSDSKSFKSIMNKAMQIFDDAPNLVSDYDHFSKDIKSKPPPKKTKVNLNFYMPAEVFQSQGKGKDFIDKAVDYFRGIYTVEALLVNIYLDTEITEQITANKNKDDNKPNENYHYYSLLNK